MARENFSLFAFNRGVVSRLGLSRVDLKRLAMGAETQTNWMPRVLGSAMLRPGLQYIGATLSNAAARFLKFIFSTTDTALLEMTAGSMRVWIADSLLTRPAVTTAVTNGSFTTDVTGWTDNDEAGATSAWVAPGYMELVGSGTARAIRDQVVTTVETGVEHALRIVIARGPVTLRVGTTAGADDYITETQLGTGTHSLSFTPTGNFNIRFFSRMARKVWVDSCTIEAAGVVTLPTPYAAADLGKLRIDQSGDAVYVACSGFQQRVLQRRGTRPAARSWSVVLYQPDDGPFKVENTTPTTLTASAITGNITLTSSVELFKSTHVGGLFSITSVGQQVTATASSSGAPTASIRVTGIGSARTFSVIISGNATASTVDLQRSYDDATWADVGAPYQWTADVTGPVTDGLDNQIVYYRLNLTTRVAPDSVTMTLTIGSGSVRGVVRVTDFTSSTQVGAEVLSDLGGTSATRFWQEGQWSDKAGWPSSVRIHEGRMWWAGLNGVWGSISDAYDAFDEEQLGDSAPINRTIGAGPVDTINWLLSLKGLLLGAQGAEYSARASSLDEPLTTTNFNLKIGSTQGSGAVDAVKVDQTGYFVGRSGTKLFDLAFDLKSYDYAATDATDVCPDFLRPGAVRIDVQRLPDTRAHVVRSDGAVAVLVVDKAEDVRAWVLVQTDGVVEDVVTLPAADGDSDDQVYYVVRRTINGSTVRYLEKWAQEINCRGDLQLCQLADAHVTYTGVATTTISAPHLALREVVVWADGADVGTDDSAATWTQRYTLDASGNATLPTAVTNYVVGLGYTAQFKSVKLGQGAGVSPLNQQKRLRNIGLIMADMHPRGVRFGSDFTHLDDMPLIEDGTEIGTATQSEYDQNLIEFPGLWTTNMRVCLQAQAPRPCTLLSVTLDLTSNS